MISYLSVCMVVALAGCGKLDRFSAGFTGDPARVCVDGVTYLQFTSGVALLVDGQGNPVTCVKGGV